MKPANHHNEDKLLEFAYGELPAPEASAVDAHVKTCAKCQEALSEIKGVRLQMASLPMVPAPDTGLDSLLAYAEQAARRNALGDRTALPWWRKIVAPLAGACALALVGVVAFQMKDELPTPAEQVLQAKREGDVASAPSAPSAAPIVAAKEDVQEEPAAPKGVAEAKPEERQQWDSTLAQKQAFQGEEKAGKAQVKELEKNNALADSFKGGAKNDEGGELGQLMGAARGSESARAKTEEPKQEIAYGLGSTDAKKSPPPPMKSKPAPKPEYAEKKKASKSVAFDELEGDQRIADFSNAAQRGAKPDASNDGAKREAAAKESVNKAAVAEAPREAPPAPAAAAPAPTAKPEAPKVVAAQPSTAAPPPPQAQVQAPGYGLGSGPAPSLGIGAGSSAGGTGGLRTRSPSTMRREAEAWGPADDRAADGVEEMADKSRADRDANVKQQANNAEMSKLLSSSRASANSGEYQSSVKTALEVLKRNPAGALRLEALTRVCEGLNKLGEEAAADSYCDAIVREFPTSAPARQLAQQRNRVQKAPAPVSRKKAMEPADDSEAASEKSAPAQKPANAEPAQAY